LYLFAQTNIQLFNQMYELRYNEQEIATVKRSYDLAMTLFTGRFRGSGKTFIAHLVGTASILASVRSAPHIIAAGLLHAAYDSGDFGDSKEGVSSAKRDYVRASVGAVVEEYIASYSELRWDQQVARSVHDKLDSLNQFEKDIVLIRLANELEDYLDLGILFCGIKKRTQAGYGDLSECIYRTIAQKLGFTELAELWEMEFEKTAIASAQPRFESIGSRDFSFVVPPLSYKRLMDVLVKRLDETPDRRKE